MFKTLFSIKNVHVSKMFESFSNCFAQMQVSKTLRNKVNILIDTIISIYYYFKLINLKNVAPVC